jgi:hypothetical protein
MTNEEIRKYQMLVRVREFGAAHRDLFPARTVAGKLFAAVASAADALQQYDSRELAGRGGEQDAIESRAAARSALRRQLRAIARVAAATEVPGLGAKFRGSLDGKDEQLLSLARTFLDEAEPFVETFVAHELPSNFLRLLQGAIDAFERAMGERASGRAERVGARTRFDVTMTAALHAVRRLNAIVPNKLDDPGTVALWNLARHIDSGRVKSGQPTPSAGSPLTSTPPQPEAA